MSGKNNRILVTGSNGQVGRALQHALPPSAMLLATDRTTLDLANPDSIRKVVRDFRPTLIINAAAYTAVDRAESEPDLAMAVNGVAPGILAEEALRLDALLLHFSTDYVFDGTKTTAYTESDAPNPLSIYGRTKLAGERAILATGAACYILRTSWVYAAEGNNFLNKILQLAQEKTELRIVDDQTGAPTWAGLIADITVKLLARDSAWPKTPATDYGVYHLTASGAVTWYGFACAILANAHLPGLGKTKVTPITTSDLASPSRRPVNSLLDTSRLQRLLGATLEPWQTGLAKCLEEKMTIAASRTVL